MPFTLISRMQDEGGLYFTVILLLVAICYHINDQQQVNKKMSIFTFLNYNIKVCLPKWKN